MGRRADGRRPGGARPALRGRPRISEPLGPGFRGRRSPRRTTCLAGSAVFAREACRMHGLGGPRGAAAVFFFSSPRRQSAAPHHQPPPARRRFRPGKRVGNARLEAEDVRRFYPRMTMHRAGPTVPPLRSRFRPRNRCGASTVSEMHGLKGTTRGCGGFPTGRQFTAQHRPSFDEQPDDGTLQTLLSPLVRWHAALLKLPRSRCLFL